jgi:hypothetical protein
MKPSFEKNPFALVLSLSKHRSAVLYFAAVKGEGRDFDKLSPNGILCASLLCFR